VIKESSEITIPASSGCDNLEEQQNYPTNSKQVYTMHEDIQVQRTFTKSKKLPVTRNGDSLWVI
jgi:hypothetical protein